MTREDLRSLLNGLGGIRHPCDVDLLLFFHRHPRALLTADSLVSYLGHDHDRVAKSLDGLIAAGLLTRSQNPSRSARLYQLNLDGHPGGQLASFLKVASARQGRNEVMRLLEPEPDAAAGPNLRRRAGLAKVA
ncbi:MAG TPA: MarR family transcriptional regulator [Burkholderiales bacterium]